MGKIEREVISGVVSPTVQRELVVGEVLSRQARLNQKIIESEIWNMIRSGKLVEDGNNLRNPSQGILPEMEEYFGKK